MELKSRRLPSYLLSHHWICKRCLIIVYVLELPLVGCWILDEYSRDKEVFVQSSNSEHKVLNMTVLQMPLIIV